MFRSAQAYYCINKRSVDLVVEIRSLKVPWSFYIIEVLTAQCIIGKNFMYVNEVDLEFS